MQALILAAGIGTRMRPLSANTPKPLLFVAGKPFIAHSLESLAACGVTDITMVVGWRQQRLRDALGDGAKYGVELHYVEQRKRRGTADAIRSARPKITGPFLCLNGDVVVSSSDIAALLEFATAHHGTIISVVGRKAVKRYGFVRLENERVTGLEEKPPTPRDGLVNAGVYVFEPTIFDTIDETPLSPRGEYEITDSIERQLAATSDVWGYRLQDEWLDVGYPWDLLTANRLMMAHLDDARHETSTVEERVTIHGAIRLGANAIIKTGTYIEGPCIIGKECVIGPNAYIRGATALADRCKIGAAAEVKNSIIMSDSNVPHHNYVGDSIIGERCNLGSGTKIANLRLDGRSVHTIVKGTRMNTHRRKLGAILGDDVKTGINSCIDVGTIIGNGSFIGPGAVAKGTLGENSRVL